MVRFYVMNRIHFFPVKSKVKKKKHKGDIPCNQVVHFKVISLVVINISRWLVAIKYNNEAKQIIQNII